MTRPAVVSPSSSAASNSKRRPSSVGRLLLPARRTARHAADGTGALPEWPCKATRCHAAASGTVVIATTWALYRHGEWAAERAEVRLAVARSLGGEIMVMEQPQMRLKRFLSSGFPAQVR
eukprot:CAMPEP_0202840896 /NCGR_PEP_ID=MMETSP1389-20130828/57046_1 /ASSEMBLY_ACC=CAM_ASM_000865 /TAXON_ID=302021 /ORGANISM="Rhodomonas sp., Strain CCMP768" /LENGTH=119 /DNA_ID=CAMNT_0049517629 /DNA_START=10 /DNA_END=367 /DNA_ORIENTATION=-